MNIDQAIDILKNSIADYVIGEYCEKCADNKICDDRNEDCCYQQAIDMVLTAYEKEKEKAEYENELRIKYQRRYDSVKEINNNAKWYVHQEIAGIEEDIEDYIDDDKEGNKHIIGELKEDLQHWKDVRKLLNGKSKDNLYMDWRKYGEYE